MKWEAQTGMCQCSTSTFEISCGCPTRDMPEWRKIIEPDRLEGKATITSGLHLRGSEVWGMRIWSVRNEDLKCEECGSEVWGMWIWSVRNVRRYQQVQNPGHHTTNHLEEGGVERGSAQWFCLKGQERAMVNQTNIGTVSKATLEKLLRDGMERRWAFPSA